MSIIQKATTNNNNYKFIIVRSMAPFYGRELWSLDNFSVISVNSGKVSSCSEKTYMYIQLAHTAAHTMKRMR